MSSHTSSHEIAPLPTFYAPITPHPESIISMLPPELWHEIIKKLSPFDAFSLKESCQLLKEYVYTCDVSHDESHGRPIISTYANEYEYVRYYDSMNRVHCDTSRLSSDMSHFIADMQYLMDISSEILIDYNVFNINNLFIHQGALRLLSLNPPQAKIKCNKLQVKGGLTHLRNMAAIVECRVIDAIMEIEPYVPQPKLNVDHLRLKLPASAFHISYIIKAIAASSKINSCHVIWPDRMFDEEDYAKLRDVISSVTLEFYKHVKGRPIFSRGVQAIPFNMTYTR